MRQPDGINAEGLLGALAKGTHGFHREHLHEEIQCFTSFVPTGTIISHNLNCKAEAETLCFRICICICICIHICKTLLWLLTSGVTACFSAHICINKKAILSIRRWTAKKKKRLC